MKRLCVFLVLTFVFTWALAWGLMRAGGLLNPNAPIIFVTFMLVPAVCVLLTRAITKEGFEDMWIKPNFKGNLKYYIMAWFLPQLLIVLGSTIYFVIFPSNFDPSMRYMMNLYRQQGVALPEGISMVQLFIAQMFTGILVAPILNLVPALGEELGWRGYLLPKLTQRYPNTTAAIITGVIWGVWHAPMIAMGHNYGLGYPYAPFGGIGAMIVFCIFVGVFLSYLALKVKSAIPAALAHGALNGFAAIGIFFVAGTANPFIGPLPTGIIGGIGFIIAGIVSFLAIRDIKQ